MKAITVQQPWAVCIARGAKLVENRSRPTSHRGPLAIHAGGRSSARGMTDPRVVTELGVTSPRHWPDLWPGAVLAVVDLVDCHPAAGCCRPWGEDTYRGRPVHHLVLDNVRRLGTPLFGPGRLGLWTVDGVCRVCACTELDCSTCIEATGTPCAWAEPDLCTRCATTTRPGDKVTLSTTDATR